MDPRATRPGKHGNDRVLVITTPGELSIKVNSLIILVNLWANHSKPAFPKANQNYFYMEID